MTHSQGALTAPFPYYGGKRWLAGTIWERLGNPGVYVEPFAGSLACLLARPGGPGPREIVCDTDAGLCNFWRATIADPEEVAYWADYPTIHQDLTARHAWLRQWVLDNAARLSQDPDFCDPKAAGWWVWGISLWIGGDWCRVTWEGRPYVCADSSGHGVSAQRTLPGDKEPYVGIKNGSRGVSQHTTPPPDQKPHCADWPGGNGVAAQRTTRPGLVDWFTRIRNRLAAVVVLNRSWESALTPTMLQRTPTAPKPPVAVMMDPPYLTDERHDAIYHSDFDGTSSDVARASWEWARDNGDWCRIAYCCHEGDFDVPDGWSAATKSISGIKREDRKHRRDMVMFSPACIPDPQERLF